MLSIDQHIMIATGTELPSAVVILDNDNTDQAPKNGETDEAEKGARRVMKINDRQDSFETQMDC